jgi:hypothetical protein
MNASADNASPGERAAEGWDEPVLVWNGMVARIPARAVEPAPADVEGGNSDRIVEREERRGDAQA